MNTFFLSHLLFPCPAYVMAGRYGRGRTGRFNHPITCKELELIILQTRIRDADVYHRWDRSVLVPESDCFRWLPTSGTMSSLTF